MLIGLIATCILKHVIEGNIEGMEVKGENVSSY
jgi:hypothetical protein